jgi:hypothetical protein
MACLLLKLHLHSGCNCYCLAASVQFMQQVCTLMQATQDADSFN